ncbi:hypothetical protein B0H17DRAFT_1232374, partial [Mycena rosella]
CWSPINPAGCTHFTSHLPPSVLLADDLPIIINSWRLRRLAQMERNHRVRAGAIQLARVPCSASIRAALIAPQVGFTMHRAPMPQQFSAVPNPRLDAPSSYLLPAARTLLDPHSIFRGQVQPLILLPASRVDPPQFPAQIPQLKDSAYHFEAAVRIRISGKGLEIPATFFLNAKHFVLNGGNFTCHQSQSWRTSHFSGLSRDSSRETGSTLRDMDGPTSRVVQRLEHGAGATRRIYAVHIQGYKSNMTAFIYQRDNTEEISPDEVVEEEKTGPPGGDLVAGYCPSHIQERFNLRGRADMGRVRTSRKGSHFSEGIGNRVNGKRKQQADWVDLNYMRGGGGVNSLPILLSQSESPPH